MGNGDRESTLRPRRTVRSVLRVPIAAALATVVALAGLALVERGSPSVSGNSVVHRSGLAAFFLPGQVNPAQPSGVGSSGDGISSPDQAVAAADIAAADADATIDQFRDNIYNRVAALRDKGIAANNPGRICGKLLQVKARFDARIQRLIARFPTARYRLLHIQDKIDTKIDNILGRLGCTISGAM